MRRCLANHENVSVHVAFSAERGKEVVLKVLHRGRGSLVPRRQLRAVRRRVQAAVRHRGSGRGRDLRLPRDEPVLLHRDGVFRSGISGRKLAQPLSPAVALRYTGEIAHALSIIHTAGVVHRDLKPGNIMLRDDGTVALIDFGISRSTHTASTTAETRRRDLGHAVLHEPGAGARRADRRAHGPLRARRDPLSDAHGREALRGRHDSSDPRPAPHAPCRVCRARSARISRCSIGCSRKTRARAWRTRGSSWRRSSRFRPRWNPTRASRRSRASRRT